MHCSSRGKGEAVLLIHGMPTNRRLWDGVAQELAGNFRCFAIDLPGMGGTPFLPYGPSYFKQVAAQIEELRIRHHVQRWHIAGHDGGCAVAVHYAHLFPKRVGCMALLSPAIFPDLRPFFLLEALRKPIAGELAAPLVHALFWHVAMRRAIPAASHAEQRNSFHDGFSGFAGPWKLMRTVRWGSPAEILQHIPAILPKLDNPTLVIHGSRDILPESFATRTADQIPNAQLIRLDAGHFSPLEKAAEIARRLAAFFAAQSAKGIGESTPSGVVATRTRARSAPKNRRRPAALVPLPAAR
jgi:pimeloyl-ACP methyl ester carboxylesterase